MQYTSTSLEDTAEIAKEFLALCIPENSQACIVGLSGDLGSGKTTFTQQIAKLLGIKETVTSPTFVIEKIYSLDPEKSIQNNFTKFIHIDAYRLESARELEKLGFKEIAEDSKNLIFIEWPERVAEILKSYTVKTLTFTFIDEKTREISRETRGENKNN